GIRMFVDAMRCPFEPRHWPEVSRAAPAHRALAWRISHGAWADFSRVPAACARRSRTHGMEPGPRAVAAGKRSERGEPHAGQAFRRSFAKHPAEPPDPAR